MDHKYNMTLDQKKEQMMQNPLISIIIPAYNVEKYLQRCLDSILNQTRKPDLVRLNLDFDNFPRGFGDTPAWVKEYLEKYDNFKVKFEAADMKVWEKIMPTIYEEEDEYILVTVDDDVTYPPTYLWG